MTISIAGSANGTTSVTLPAHQSGDLIIAASYRNGANIRPALPAGWTNITDGGNNSNSLRICFKIASSSSETATGFTNATYTLVTIYRSSNGTMGIGAAASGGANTDTLVYPALTLTGASNTSRVAAFGGKRTQAAFLENDLPNGSNLVQSVISTAGAVSFDSGATVTSWPAANGMAFIAAAWRTASVEITETPPPPPPPPSGTNPTSIMGVNALSWVDVAEGGMFQDTAGTTPASVGDPVRFVPDGAGGSAYLHDGGTVGVPVLRDGYLEFDAGFLRKLVSRASGPIAYGMRLRRVDELPTDVEGPLVIGGTATEWYSGEWAAFFQNGFFTPDNWFGETNNGGAGGLPAGAVDVFQTLHQSISGGANEFRLDGAADTSQTTPNVGATSRVWLGGKGVNFGTFEADPGRYDIVRFYLLNAIPDSTQLTALENWLENGDSGPAGGISITRGTPQSIESVGGGTNITIPIGAAANDRVIMVVMSGEGAAPLALPTGATLGGNAMTLVGDGQFVSEFNDATIIAAYAIAVPAGTADLTLNYSMANTAFSVVVTPYRITGANLPTSSSVAMNVGGSGDISATVVNDGALISRVRQYGTADREVVFNGVAIDTAETQNFYASRRIYDSFAFYETGAVITVSEPSSDGWAAAITIPLEPLAVSGTSLNYWTGSAWVLAPLMRWNGTAWIPAQLQRWTGTVWEIV